MIGGIWLIYTYIPTNIIMYMYVQKTNKRLNIYNFRMPAACCLLVIFNIVEFFTQFIIIYIRYSCCTLYINIDI